VSLLGNVVHCRLSLSQVPVNSHCDCDQLYVYLELMTPTHKLRSFISHICVCTLRQFAHQLIHSPTHILKLTICKCLVVSTIPCTLLQGTTFSPTLRCECVCRCLGLCVCLRPICVGVHVVSVCVCVHGCLWYLWVLLLWDGGARMACDKGTMLQHNTHLAGLYNNTCRPTSTSAHPSTNPHTAQFNVMV